MKKHESGLTMVEVMVASIILVAISAMAMSMMLSSSNHVANMEVGVRMELTAREVITAMSAELRQAKMTSVEFVNTSVGPLYSSNVPALTDVTTLPGSGSVKAATQITSYTVPSYYTTPYIGANGSIPANTDYRSDPYGTPNIFNGIRFHIPGHQMDLTKNNANADNGNANDNFNLNKFKNSSTTSDWVTEIQYWWEADGTISQGVVKRTETTRDSSGNFKTRHYAIVARNVASLSISIPKYPGFVNTTTYPTQVAAAPYVYTTANPEKQVAISIQMQEPDPKYPKDATKNIYRTLSSIVDVRN
ncbi:MAG TPA: hypothetical protein VKW04_02400 [Planctomycetota bacterium]|nr:hypothetical protein [Planctomycetota bacterium]